MSPAPNRAPTTTRATPRTPPEARLRDEDHIQWAVARVLDVLGLRWAHPPNEALQRGSQADPEARRASQAYGALMVGLGVKAGLPDVLIFSRLPAFPEARWVAIELKTRAGKPSPAQEEWETGLRADGWRSGVAYGLADAFAQVQAAGWDVRGALRVLEAQGWVPDFGRDRLVRVSAAATGAGGSTITRSGT